jgi:hypothetical protein
MTFLLYVAANPDYSHTLQTLLYAIGGGGFVIAVIGGSIAWYNSKKPAGWEGSEAPGWVPKVSETPNSKSDQAE